MSYLQLLVEPPYIVFMLDNYLAVEPKPQIPETVSVIQLRRFSFCIITMCIKMSLPVLLRRAEYKNKTQQQNLLNQRHQFLKVQLYQICLYILQCTQISKSIQRSVYKLQSRSAA